MSLIKPRREKIYGVFRGGSYNSGNPANIIVPLSVASVIENGIERVSDSRIKVNQPGDYLITIPLSIWCSDKPGFTESASGDIELEYGVNGAFTSFMRTGVYTSYNHNDFFPASIYVNNDFSIILPGLSKNDYIEIRSVAHIASRDAHHLWCGLANDIIGDSAPSLSPYTIIERI